MPVAARKTSAALRVCGSVEVEDGEHALHRAPVALDPQRLSAETAALKDIGRRADLLAGRTPDPASAPAVPPGAWAADRAASAVAALGHAGVMVEIGRHVAGRGRRPDGAPWRVAVEAPEAGRVALVLVLDDASLATAVAGEAAVPGLVSATVVHADGAWAGALAQALLALGPDRGRALAARERLAARLVLRQEDAVLAEWSTPQLEALAAPAR
jgi:hypothetical protein